MHPALGGGDLIGEAIEAPFEFLQSMLYVRTVAAC
jgi:hypothetical protein